MARKPRLFVPYGTYHVYCRVARGELIFENKGNSDLFLETLSDVRDRDGLSILAWCLMRNHYHIVVKTGSVPLWRTMARFQRTVSRKHNRKMRYLGRLWQSRYRARFVDSNEYFLQLVAYVHLNPVVAGLVNDPAEYELSGHREAIGRTPARILDMPAFLALFEDECSSEAKTAYMDWLRLVAEAKWLGGEIRELPWWQGAKDVEEITTPSPNLPVESFDEQRLVEDRPPLTMARIVVAFSAVSGVGLDELRSRAKRHEIARARCDLTAIAVGRFGHRSCDLARILEKNAGSVSRWLTEADSRFRNDPAYRSQLDRLERRITQHAIENVTL